MILAIVFGLVARASFATSQTFPPATPVFPTGKFPDDLANVKAALKQSTSILLKATDLRGKPTPFNFGLGAKGEGQLTIGKDHCFLGETVHGKETTILGGDIPILVLAPVQVKVSGIHFESPMLGAIFFQKSGGADVVGNVISNVRPLPNFEHAQSMGIGVFGPEIKGHILICGNTIDNVEASDSYGILVSNTDCDIEISHNTVRGVQINGILAGYATHDVLIYKNRVAPGVAKAKLSAGNAILAGHGAGGHFHVIDNMVECENPNADGIVLVGNDKNPAENSDVVGNEVAMITTDSLDSSGIGLYGHVSHSNIYGNRIRGAGAYALKITELPPYDTGTAYGNLILNNRLSGFTATTATLYLNTAAQATVFRGSGSDCIDMGKDDSIRGLKKSSKKPSPES